MQVVTPPRWLATLRLDDRSGSCRAAEARCLYSRLVIQRVFLLGQSHGSVRQRVTLRQWWVNDRLLMCEFRLSSAICRELTVTTRQRAFIRAFETRAFGAR